MKQLDAKGRRLILGFDAGCMTCSELARRIEEHSRNKLEVRSLRDPQVDHFRKQALGDDASWAPTLIEINGTKVRAWTGLKMGVVLSRHLGFVATWRMMQALGELSTPRQDVETETARSGISRKQFVKGLGGAVVTLGVLSGSGNIPSTAAAQADAPAGFKSVKRVDFRGNALIARAREIAQRKDVENIMTRAWAVRLQEGSVTPVAEGGAQAILVEETTQTPVQSEGHTGVRISRIGVKAARHTLANGTGMLAVGYKLPDGKIVIYYEFDQAVPYGAGEFKTRAALHSVDGEDLVLEGLSINGGPVSLEDTDSLSTGRVGCGSCWTTYRHRTRACLRQKWGCLLVACGACIPACLSVPSCAYCALVQCPYAYLFTCCRRRGYVCAPCRG